MVAITCALTTTRSHFYGHAPPPAAFAPHSDPHSPRLRLAALLIVRHERGPSEGFIQVQSCELPRRSAAALPSVATSGLVGAVWAVIESVAALVAGDKVGERGHIALENHRDTLLANAVPCAMRVVCKWAIETLGRLRHCISLPNSLTHPAIALHSGAVQNFCRLPLKNAFTIGHACRFRSACGKKIDILRMISCWRNSPSLQRLWYLVP